MQKRVRNLAKLSGAALTGVALAVLAIRFDLLPPASVLQSDIHHVEAAALQEYTVAVDRIEEGKAVLMPVDEDGRQIVVPIRKLPELVREGDLLNVELNEVGEVTRADIDWEATRFASERVQDMLRKAMW